MKGINENSFSIIGDATDKINFFYQRYSIIQQVERKLGYAINYLHSNNYIREQFVMNCLVRVLLMVVMKRKRSFS